MIRIKWYTITFLLVAVMFMSSSLFGVLHMGMNMNPDGTMDDCPFSTGTSMCTMTPLEHLGAVQSLFTSIPQQKNILVFFLLFIILIIATLFFWQSASPPRILAYKRVSNDEYIPTHSFLQEAFSCGILHSKAF